MTGPEITRCATHPNVETSLRCGKCNKPICPKCMVQTPVGARCPDCAHLYKLPTYRVSGVYYLRAAGAALGMALVTGFIWGAIVYFLPFRFFSLILAAGIGYAIGEVISLAVNRKRGTWLAVTGGAAVLIAYAVNILTLGTPPFTLFPLIFDTLGVIIGVYMAANRLR